MTPSLATHIAFVVLAALAVLSGWRVFCTDSMVRASFFLLLSFIAVGGIMILLTAEYLGVAMFFMMAVEMMVMALFMVMFMMNPAGLNPMKMVHQERVAIVAGVAVFGVLSAVAVLGDFPDMPLPAEHAPVISLGRELLGDSMLVFETAGVVLLTTMVGVVVLSSRRGRYGRADEGSVPPGLEPGGEPAGRPKESEEEKGEEGGHAHQHHH
ncbi:NADH-quinone oxidoreductase subunit J [Halomonas sp. MCCC 1A17488]|uniref:NADH-quinone oxidoreductase subunit J n=1 Tax=Billgrantia sulfidoxydans TaxID=2733484 RepID=A0ABX7W4U2_9GAMM|nr:MULTISPECIES: NADH-quinone oxidoreductase subunit J [Halomonas]MCE8016364.1 NADH-quinone oxidoreductase subunit J [Halomonas sp. MCCC 1A17488]MCG3239697.1 NADH-quinone oxidoreductase subunit J [Halomonas sp. MCCC 1A17488]QPP50394.1 NADH-quinone oxidoreductase subunit J [Halomonas sp. SS10-MC5]QTP54013.1 NADH-quinone oxidoreductase subunit J [Halomonas sulfidoxydans]